MTTSSKSGPRAPLPFLGLACAVGVSTIYYNQPLLLEMGRTYGVDGRSHRLRRRGDAGRLCGWYAGFVPLGDVLERRALMMRMYGAVAVALLLVASRPSLTWLIAGSVLLGHVCFGDAYCAAHRAGPGFA